MPWQVNYTIGYNCSDSHKPEYSQKELDDGLLLQVQHSQWDDNAGKDEQAETVRISTAVFGEKVAWEVLISALVDAAKVERQVDRPGRPSHCAIGQTCSKCNGRQQQEVSYLEPRSAKYLALLAWLKLAC